MSSNRTRIANLIIDNLKKINGNFSDFDDTYLYQTNLSENVYRGIRFIDEINDFPAIYVQTDEEIRTYNTNGLTEAELLVVLRCYCHTESSTRFLEDLTQDIEHVIYHLPFLPDVQIQDIVINSINTDEGILEPYGVCEIVLTILYEIGL